ncbi:MAG TPA: YggT family protein [Pyrinomonadaceae bacterium]|jgi:YggT family protein|nr:YggT family protein [Pyrinomonadaceae bacterium]
MQIISRTYLWLSWAIALFIVGVIVLMVLRLIVDALDLNPFGWISRTIHRLTDGFLIPVRGGLRNFGMDPKFAPLVVILLVILLGYFLLQLIGAICSTILGVLVSVREGAMISVLGYLLYGAISIYILLIIMRIVFSWGRLSYRNRIMRFLIDVTEPLLGPLRRIIPPLGWIDISPIVAFIILWLFQAAIAGTLIRGAPLQAF